MQLLRAFLHARRWTAFAVIALALCMKVLVPTGMMVGSQSKVFQIEICAEAMGQTLTKAVTIPMKHAGGDDAAKQAKDHCPWAGASHVPLAGTDPVQLALALAFIVALGFAAARPLALARRTYLQPPLRGPPALA
jgi:Zn-dependent protease